MLPNLKYKIYVKISNLIYNIDYNYIPRNVTHKLYIAGSIVSSPLLARNLTDRSFGAVRMLPTSYENARSLESGGIVVSWIVERQSWWTKWNEFAGELYGSFDCRFCSHYQRNDLPSRVHSTICQCLRETLIIDPDDGIDSATPHSGHLVPE